MSDDEQPASAHAAGGASHENDGISEAQLRMQQEMQKRKERAAEELAEYEEMRKVEREKEEQEIRELRERREKRKKERMEEEKRLSELRAIEEQKRRAEEEERIRKKKEEEAAKKEERERRQREAKEKTQSENRPNYTIHRKAVAAPQSTETEAEGKSKEQLEAERKAALEQRCKPLNIAGFNEQQLREKAKELHDRIFNLESENYDSSKRFEEQNYNMMELGEKVRQVQKGASKNAKVNVNQSPDPLAAKMTGIPPRIVMYSQYERVKDRRTFGEKKDVYTGPMYKEEYIKIEPSQKVVMTEMGARAVENDENSSPAAKEPEANGEE